MAVAFVRDHGYDFAKAAGTTDTFFLVSGGSTSGNVLVAIAVFDNAATASKPVISSISKQAGETNNWVFLGAARSTSTSAGAFASGEMWAIKTTVAWSDANAITFTWDTSITMKSENIIEFSGAEATLRSTVGTAYSTTTTAASAATTGTTPVIGDLAIGLLFGSNVAAVQAGDNDTTGGSWSAPTGAVPGIGSTGGSGATNNFGAFQYKILTGANHQTFNNSAAMTAGNGSIVAILQATPEPTVTQAAYRFYADGPESSSTALAAQDTAYTADLSNTKVDSYEVTGGSFGLTSYIKVAQSVTGNGQFLRRASFWIGRVGSPPGNVVAELYDATGAAGSRVPTGAALATSTTVIAASSLSTTQGWVDFDFDGMFTLANGTTYCLALTATAQGVAGTDYVASGQNTTSPPAGNGSRYAFVSSTWVTHTAGTHFPYRLHTSPAGNLQVRVRLQSTNVAALPATDDWQLQWEKNASGIWNDVSGTDAKVAEHPVTQRDGDTNMGHSAAQLARAQSFLGDGSTVTNVDWYARAVGSPVGNLTAYLYAHTGTFGSSGTRPTGPPLATSPTMSATALAGTYSWVRFNLPGSVQAVSGTPYFVAVVVDTFTDTSNCIYIGYDVTAPTHPGRGLAGTSAAWTDAGGDMVFQVIADTSAVPYASALLDNTAPSTNRLGAGSGSFTAGDVTEDGVANDQGWPGNNYTEHVYSITLKAANLANGDTLRFRVLRNGATTSMTYTQVPTINVTKAAGLTTVTITRPTTWNVKGQPTITRATTWDTLLAVTKTLSATTWDTRFAVAPALGQTTWRTRQAVTKTLGSTTWQIRSQVSVARATTWDVLTPVVKALGNTTWKIKQTVAPTRGTTWNTKGQPTVTRATTWNVAAATAPSVPVETTRSTTWDVLTPVTFTRVASWDATFAVVKALGQTTWKIRQAVALTRLTTWDVTTPVVKVLGQTTWKIRQAITPTRVAFWDVTQAVALTRSTTWDALFAVVPTRATTWNTDKAVALSRLTTWDVITPVTLTRSTTWNIFSVPTIVRSTTWNVAGALTQVTVTRAVSWRTLQVVGSTAVVTLAYDSFDRANNAAALGTSDSGHPWATLFGTFGINSNQATVSTGNDSQAVLAVTHTDVVVSALIPGLGGTVGLLARCTDLNNTYHVQSETDGDIFMFKRVGGTWTQLGAVVPGAFLAGHVLGLSCQGTTISALIDGVPVRTVTDSAHASGIRVGLRTGNAGMRWDNFLVTAPEAGVGRSTSWDAVKSVTITRSTTWDATTPVTINRSTTWRAKAPVTTTRVVTWDAREAVALSRLSTWNIRALVGPVRATTWDVLSVRTLTRATTWDTTATVAPTRATTWDATATVVRVRSTTWNVAEPTLGTVNVVRSTTWNAKKVLAVTRVTTWDVLTPVAVVTRSTTWDATVAVSLTRATTWDSRTAITLPRSTTWRQRAVVVQVRSTLWRVEAAVSLVRATTWDVTTPVIRTRGSTWNIRGQVVQVRSTSWNVIGFSAQITVVRSTTWKTRAAVTAVKTTTWDTRVQIVVVKSVLWDARLAVVTVRSATWRATRAVVQVRSTTWKTSAAVVVVRSTLWDSRELIVLIVDASWNVKGQGQAPALEDPGASIVVPGVRAHLLTPTSSATIVVTRTHAHVTESAEAEVEPVLIGATV